MSLRVERHPRGHVASCNGRVELVHARAEVCRLPVGEASEMAALVENVEKVEREKKCETLRSFQRDVRRRVGQRERSRQRQLAASSSRALHRKQRAAERAVALEPRGVPLKQTGLEMDDGEVGVVSVAAPAAAARARLALLAKKAGPGTTPTSAAMPTSTVPLQDNSSPPGAEAGPLASGGRPLQRTPPSSTVPQGGRSPDSVVQRFTAPGQLECAQRQAAGQQFLTFRRLYSALEREQARHRRQTQRHRKQVQHVRQRKEQGRQQMEWAGRQQMEWTGHLQTESATNSLSTAGSEAAEEERAREWAELVALERRRGRLQGEREGERYVEALRGQLRERLSRHTAPLPALCCCGPSPWECGPASCANNCVFYRNPKEYTKALSNLLLSLES